MSLLVTGSIAIDSVQTPHGQKAEVLGGSACYFAVAARLFGPVRLAGVVGEDFPDEYRKVLEEKDIDLAGLETRAGSKTFRWSGSYHGDMNEAQTKEIHLNVLAEKPAEIPPAYRDSEYLFLANTMPQVQTHLIEQLAGPKLILADTRDFWIEQNRAELADLLGRIHGLLLNDQEAQLLADENNLVTAAKKILDMGPEFVVIKKGSHGVMMMGSDGVLLLPAYPMHTVVDPTGAGDSFAGGMLGYLASTGKTAARDDIRLALAYGSIIAGFCIESFSLGRLGRLTLDDVERRLSALRDMARF